MYLLFLSLLSLFVATSSAEEINVISERSIKNLNDTVSDITVFDQASIRDSGAATIKEFLEKESDIHIFSPGVGQPESVQIRGNDARHTLILVDGQSISDITGTDGSARLESVSLQNITKIEVLKGSESVLYGSQAIGGVINIITDQKKAGGNLAWKMGSYRLRKAALDYKIIMNKWSAQVFSNFESRKDFSVRPRSLNNKHDDDETQKINSGLNIKRVTDDSKLTLQAKYYNYKYDYDSSASEELDDQGEYENFFYGVNYEKNWTKKLKTRFDYGLTKIDRKIYGVDNNSGYSFVYKGKSHNASMTGELKSKRSHLVFGADSLKEKALALGSSLAQARSRSELSLFLNNDLKAGRHILATGVRGTKIQSRKAFANYKLGIVSKWSGLAWRNNLTTGFKAPSLYNLYSTFEGNPNLKVEKARTMSSSLSYKNKLLGKSNLSLFRTKYKNYIDYNFSTSSYNNVSSALIRGYEISWQKSWPLYFRTILSYTYLNTKNLETGKYLNLRAKNTIKGKVNYYISDSTNLGSTYRFVGRRDDTSGTLPSYSLFDLNFNYKKINIAIKNIFDKDYQELGGFQTFGRNVVVGTRYAI